MLSPRFRYFQTIDIDAQMLVTKFLGLQLAYSSTVWMRLRVEVLFVFARSNCLQAFGLDAFRGLPQQARITDWPGF